MKRKNKMNILILNGNSNSISDKSIQFDKRLNELRHMLERSGNSVKLIELRTKNINDCIGCYDCWLKTPGLCIWKDDMEDILINYVKADVFILASPVKMKFISSLTKRINDRMLPTVHPYLIMREDRMGHIMRYDNEPEKLLILDDVNETEHIHKTYGNTQRKLGNILDLSSELEAICHAITHY